jgi:hypothetical protein
MRRRLLTRLRTGLAHFRVLTWGENETNCTNLITPTISNTIVGETSEFQISLYRWGWTACPGTCMEMMCCVLTRFRKYKQSNVKSEKSDSLLLKI